MALHSKIFSDKDKYFEVHNKVDRKQDDIIDHVMADVQYEEPGLVSQTEYIELRVIRSAVGDGNCVVFKYLSNRYHKAERSDANEKISKSHPCEPKHQSMTF